MKHYGKALSRLSALLMAAVLLALTACAGGYNPDAPRLKLNGKRLDVYTEHYLISEDCAIIPLTAFLESIGAEYADSPLNEYHITCYSFMGKRYVVDENSRLFMLEDDYVTLSKELQSEGKSLSRKNAAGRDLFSENEDEFFLPSDEHYTVLWSGMWVDHVSLMNALRKSGVDITIEYDYATRTISVSLPEKSK